jgi:hypothetical protein
VALEHDAAPAAPQPQAAPLAVAAPESAPVIRLARSAVATPSRSAGGAPLGDDEILSLQKTAGNRAVGRAIDRGLIQRDDAAPAAAAALTGVTITPQKASIPLSGTTITAAAKPAGAGTIKYSIAADKVAPAAGTTIDESTGAVTLDAKQPGGSLKIKAENESSFADSTFKLIEKPAAIASTSASATGTYKASFVHTFTSAGTSPAGLDGENINEKFDSLSADTPFGPFALEANAAGSKGWDLDSSGTMAGPDNLSIGKGIDATPFVKNASNPTPAKALPQGFTMTQKLHAKSFPDGTLDASPFTTTDHVRTLEDVGGKLQMTLKAGVKGASIDYAGPAVFRNAKADKTSVEASPEKPKTGTWKRNEVQVSVDVAPAGGKVKYSITGEALGCTVDASGKVLIGSAPGKITVRAGDGTHYDEVSIEIKKPAAAAVAPGAGAGAAPKAAGAGDEAVPTAGAEDPGQGTTD